MIEVATVEKRGEDGNAAGIAPSCQGERGVPPNLFDWILEGSLEGFQSARAWEQAQAVGADGPNGSIAILQAFSKQAPRGVRFQSSEPPQGIEPGFYVLVPRTFQK